MDCDSVNFLFVIYEERPLTYCMNQVMQCSAEDVKKEGGHRELIRVGRLVGSLEETETLCRHACEDHRCVGPPGKSTPKHRSGHACWPYMVMGEESDYSKGWMLGIEVLRHLTLLALSGLLLWLCGIILRLY